MDQDRILHITHGESANERLASADIPGEFLGWDDPLHHGPVPLGPNLEELTDLRAKFISDRGWGEYPDVRAAMDRRNRLLARCAEAGEVVVWSSFELFDQLQLVQILDWFEQHQLVFDPPSVIWLSGYFSDQPRAELVHWFREREPVDDETLISGSRVWQAFCSPEPDSLIRYANRPVPGLPFMQKAVARLLQEYPGSDDGLSRTQRQILSILDESPQGPVTVFELNQERESPAFMGDWSFWWEIERLCDISNPAIRVSTGQFVAPPSVDPMSPGFVDQQLELSPFGQKLVLGRADFVAENGIDRWIGGVHLRFDHVWRWSAKDRTVRRQAG